MLYLVQHDPHSIISVPAIDTHQSSLIVQLKVLLNRMAQLEAEKTAEGHSPVLSPTDFVNQLKYASL